MINEEKPFEDPPKNILWVENLYEVSSMVREQAREMENELDLANQRFLEAKREYELNIKRIMLRYAKFEQELKKYWTEDEIAAAKKGQTLIK